MTPTWWADFEKRVEAVRNEPEELEQIILWLVNVQHWDPGTARECVAVTAGWDGE